MERFDADAILADKSFEILFAQEFPAGSAWHHATRKLVLYVVERVDTLLAQNDSDVRVAIDRPYIKPDDADDVAKPSKWNLVIIFDDNAVVSPMVLSERLVMLGDKAVYVGDSDGGPRLLESVIAEIENAHSEQSLGWI